MKTVKLFLTLMAASAVLASNVRAQLTPEQIVAQVDSVRNPTMDYSVNARVTSHKPKRPDRVGVYEVLMKGAENTIVKTLEPQTERGQALLMRGPDFWAFFPDVAKPIRISLQEKLTGDVSNGDIARTNFSGDYIPTLLRDDTIDGKLYYVLDLKGKTDTATYGRVVLWVAHETYAPLKAEFYAISGPLLKTCAYENYKMMVGKERPSRLVLTDAVIKGQYSTIEYDTMTEQEIPEKYFSKEYLKKLTY